MINFLDGQVVYDCFFMSFKEFSLFYEREYELNPVSCQIIWYGVRDFVSQYSIDFAKSNQLKEKELIETKKRITLIKESIFEDNRIFFALAVTDAKINKKEKTVLLQATNFSPKEIENIFS